MMEKQLKCSIKDGWTFLWRRYLATQTGGWAKPVLWKLVYWYFWKRCVTCFPGNLDRVDVFSHTQSRNCREINLVHFESNKRAIVVVDRTLRKRLRIICGRLDAMCRYFMTIIWHVRWYTLYKCNIYRICRNSLQWTGDTSCYTFSHRFLTCARNCDFKQRWMFCEENVNGKCEMKQPRMACCKIALIFDNDLWHNSSLFSDTWSQVSV